jgi:hypothetical protein
MKALATMLAEATSLKALTLWQPWAWAIATPEAGKDVENRTWKPPASILGRPVAIHAGLAFDEDAADGLREGFGLAVPTKKECTLGAVVAVALLQWAVTNSPSRWAMTGQWHWCLSQVVALPEPVACKGAQGLWPLSPATFETVRLQVLRVIRAETSSVTPPLPSARCVESSLQKGRLLPCDDCKGLMLWYREAPARHGFNRIGGPTGRVDSPGRPQP